MQTYWDYTPKERAALTRDEVEKFLDGELMTKGVLKVDEPRLDKVPEFVTPKGTAYHTVDWAGESSYSSREQSEFLFATAADAEAFIAMRPMRLKDDWQSKLKHAQSLADGHIVPVSILSEAEHQSIQSAAASAQSVKQANERKRTDYARDSETMRKVIDDIWSDWSKRLDEQASHKKVLATFDEYVTIAGNEATAMTFLRKALDDSEIKDAFEWCERELPEMPPLPE